MKNFLPVLTIVALFYSCGNANSSAGKKDSTSPGSTVIEKKENWRYYSDTDKMDNKTTFFADCKSLNSVDLSFPYDGGSKLIITLRKGFKGSSNEAILSISKGQFMTSLDRSETIRAKFDDDKPQSFHFGMAKDGSSDYVFLSESSDFILKLKSAKKVMIEVEFYGNGLKQFEFDVTGLDWSK